MQDLVTFEATAGRDALTPHRNEDQSTTIHFLLQPNASQLFQNFDQAELDVLTTKDAAFYVHNFGFSTDLFQTDLGIKNAYTATSQTKDEKGEWFVASVESKEYPFFGTQFHPEKQMALFYPEFHLNHSEEVESVNRKFADFFVALSRKNGNSFPSYDEEVAALIENYPLEIVPFKLSVGEVYLF